MTTTNGRPDERLRSDLDAVRRAMLADTGVDADAIVDEAEAERHELVARAQRAADGEVEREQQRCEAAASALAAAVLTRTRSEARTRVLERQAELRRELVERTRDAAREMRSGDRYPALLDHLEALARRQLGPDAHIERDPDPAGGVVATRGTRRVDYTLDALADRAVGSLADEIAELWS